jgi:hypothetical protein
MVISTQQEQVSALLERGSGTSKSQIESVFKPGLAQGTA